MCFIQWKQYKCYQPANVTCLEHQAIFIIFKILGEIKVGARILTSNLRHSYDV